VAELVAFVATVAVHVLMLMVGPRKIVKVLWFTAPAGDKFESPATLAKRSKNDPRTPHPCSSRRTSPSAFHPKTTSTPTLVAVSF
jgi:hypothetical protein